MTQQKEKITRFMTGKVISIALFTKLYSGCCAIANKLVYFCCCLWCVIWNQVLTICNSSSIVCNSSLIVCNSSLIVCFCIHFRWCNIHSVLWYNASRTPTVTRGAPGSVQEGGQEWGGIDIGY